MKNTAARVGPRGVRGRGFAPARGAAALAASTTHAGSQQGNKRSAALRRASRKETPALAGHLLSPTGRAQVDSGNLRFKNYTPAWILAPTTYRKWAFPLELRPLTSNVDYDKSPIEIYS